MKKTFWSRRNFLFESGGERHVLPGLVSESREREVSLVDDLGSDALGRSFFRRE